ncbi:MAG: hemolysin III family protein [Clostridiales bacterium]|nr:hemolysin III family protein [Clostridiales bacterium]
MAKNIKHWEKMMSSDSDRKAAKAGRDPLEMGLSEMSWFQRQTRRVKNTIEKTRETFGEEVGNSITAGVLALYLLIMLPYGAVRAYLHAPDGMSQVDSLGVACFLFFGFLASLFTTIYHFQKPGSLHKRIFAKLDHIMVYFGVFGVFVPVCLSIVGGGLGLGILIAEFALALLGMFLMIFMYPDNKTGSRIAVMIYGIMGIIGLFILKPIHEAATAPCFWLLIAGTAVYAVGLFFYSGKKFKFSHMVWHLLVVAAQVCHVLSLVYFLR